MLNENQICCLIFFRIALSSFWTERSEPLFSSVCRLCSAVSLCFGFLIYKNKCLEIVFFKEQKNKFPYLSTHVINSSTTFGTAIIYSLPGIISRFAFSDNENRHTGNKHQRANQTPRHSAQLKEQLNKYQAGAPIKITGQLLNVFVFLV